MIHAAGVLFLAPDDKALFLKRDHKSDHPGEWCLPGGKLKKNELPEDAATREAKEEIGFLPEGVLVEHTRTQADNVDYTTFRQHVQEEFHPTPTDIYEEHSGYAWAPVGSPPEPLHPGCAIALARLSMDELGVARAIAAGQLTSPQRIDTLPLYAMRVSGTGVSYRRGLDEFVWRDPDLYLSQDMIDRCAGLPVIMEHPEANTLNSEEFADRIVGAVMFGYVKDDELWCVARIYDDEAIAMMEKDQLSTSPAVVFKDPTVNSKKTIEGKTVLIEGKPSLLDHLAICQHGVWDKGGAPTGIDVVRKDSVMTEDEKKADAAKKDAEEKEAKEKADAAAKADADAGQKIDKILTHLDSLGRRMDAWDEKEKAKADAAKADEEEKEKEEKERADKAKKDAAEEKEEKGDPEKLAADKAKKDAEDEKEREEKEKADAARKDSLTDMQRQIADINAKMPKARSDSEFAAIYDAQNRWDKAYSGFGQQSAPRPWEGETTLAYERRCAKEMKKHSAQWKESDLDVLSVDPKTFKIVTDAIYADALAAANDPINIPEDTLIERVNVDRLTGQRTISFHGSPSAWTNQFKSGKQYVGQFRTGNRGDR
jgi:8-oxo-dGTP pyrophosphatase MutT (NUDIX family)